jgi:putative intracellular protease/amidase
MGASGNPTGIWAEELATPWALLTDAGHQVVFASPQGGSAHFDPSSIKPGGENPPSVQRFLQDPTTSTVLESLPALDRINLAAVDGLFFPGGHGTMWDLPQSRSVKRAVESTVRAAKPIAAVCHGVAALVSAQTPSGASVVRGIRINAFTDAEERAAGLDSVVPFMLESRLREIGALFEGGPLWEPYAVSDGLFITGQNPASSQRVAELLAQRLQTAH